MKKIKVPTWEQTALSMPKDLNPLSTFVNNHQPLYRSTVKKWRKDLQNLIDWVIEESKK